MTDEDNLIQRYKDGDIAAANELLSLNEALVKSIFRRHYHTHVSAEDDFLQEGRLGVLEACKRYDPEKAKQFGFYKSLWIRKKMGRLNKKELSFSYRKQISEFNQRNNTANLPNIVRPLQGVKHDIDFMLDYENLSDILPKKDHDRLVHAATQYKVTKDKGTYAQLNACC